MQVRHTARHIVQVLDHFCLVEIQCLESLAHVSRGCELRDQHRRVLTEGHQGDNVSLVQVLPDGDFTQKHLLSLQIRPFENLDRDFRRTLEHSGMNNSKCPFAHDHLSIVHDIRCIDPQAA